VTVGGPLSIAAGIIGGELVAMVLLWSLVPLRPALRMRGSTVGSLLGFGGQLTLIRILGSFRGTFDYIVVGAAIGAAALGFYGMAYKLPELLIENVLWIFSTVALPTYARALRAGRDSLLSAMLRATRLLALFGLTTGAVLAVLARDAVPVLFSGRWTPAVVPMALISLSLGIMSIAWASGDVFSVLGRPGTLLLLDVPATAGMAALFLLAPRYGLVGVAAVHLVFNVVYCLARLTLLRHVTAVPLRSLLESVAPAVVVAAPTAVVGFTVQHFLPAGRLLSLVILAALCSGVAAGLALLTARASVLEAVRAVLPARTPVAASEGGR
jgi:PST family polysaccharide transporter